MLAIRTVQAIPLQQGEGRHLRYVVQTRDLMDNDPFIILADDKFVHNTFADHPHKGIQTVTYVLEGNLEHFDSETGGGRRLYEGDFQIMTAGSGIIHNENPKPGEEVRVLQLWVNLSSEDKKASGQYVDLPHREVPVLPIEGGKIEVYAGEVSGVASPLKLFTPFLYAVVSLEDNASYDFPIPAGYNSYLYMLEGKANVSGQQINTFDVVHFEQNESADIISLSSTEKTKFLIFSGKPIKQPIVASGPFVMNTEEEINEAFDSYRNGTFLQGKSY
ncbi:pirin-like C-terminal cupin domain-containing protein [Psychrobacillus sp.]|uniref:pirin family protein n=1 Tax=Psychrobacillus sp. TaxID=1871623 RepID=UPI0028BDF4EB|nr:pirin-like C-terminal cupin domain-containing protein [Psychrobacillus sp.]